MDSVALQWTAPDENGLEAVNYVVSGASKFSNHHTNCSYKTPGGCQVACSLLNLQKNAIYTVTISACLMNPLTNKLECVAQTNTIDVKTPGMLHLHRGYLAFVISMQTHTLLDALEVAIS